MASTDCDALTTDVVKREPVGHRFLDRTGNACGDFIAEVDGDLQNVIGLPLRLLVDMLSRDYPGLRMPDEEILKKACETFPL